jgi:transcriptional regulator with XRE-family HTH domain
MKTIQIKLLPNDLRRLRLRRGFSQKEVAAIFGLKSAAIISRWEAGSCLPESLNLLSLAILYRTTTEGLLFDFMRELKDYLLQREEIVFGKTEE